MVGEGISQQLRAFHTCSLKMPSSSSLTKTLIHTLFTSQLRRVSRVLSTARSFLVEVFSKRWSSSSSPPRPVHFFIYLTRNKKNKIHIGSFRMHYNWCSSRSWSVPASDLPAPATWQCEEVGAGDDLYNDDDPSELIGYLRWLEEKKVATVDTGGDNGRNEIDELADMFIAQCREKFILEKQESERKFREMLARSI